MSNQRLAGAKSARTRSRREGVIPDWIKAQEPQGGSFALRCPLCEGVTRVVDSRRYGDGIKRRRLCLGDGCHHRFTTFEFEGEDRLLVREQFDAAIAQVEAVLTRLGEVRELAFPVPIEDVEP